MTTSATQQQEPQPRKGGRPRINDGLTAKQRCRERAKHTGLCVGCVKKPPTNGYLRCDECRARIWQYRRTYQAKNGVPSSCDVCGQMFIALPYDLKRGRRTCGNKDCATKVAWDTRGRETIEERFWRNVDKTPGQGPKGDCWGWKGSTTPDGYGQLGGIDAENTKRAYVVSYEIHYGPVPDGLIVMHFCDNPPCSNPDHLSAGTHEENLHQASLHKGLKEEISLNDLKASDLIVTQQEIESRIEAISLRNLAHKALDKLTPRQRHILIRRFGLDGEGEHTLEEIGQEQDCTRERIRQIEAKALARLRHPAVSRDLRAALAA